MPQDSLADGDAFRLPLAEAVPLSQFLADRIILTLTDRRLIVEQAIGLLEHVYVHLPVKQALYGIDPVKRLRRLRRRLDTHAAEAAEDDLPFHRGMVAILSTCRDMHTGYYLPRPFDRGVAFLPFQIEAFQDGPARGYIVPRTLPDCPEILAAPDFQRGVEILAWNGDPIADAVLREGETSPGINAGARRARGAYRLTARFLAKCPPPERDTVRVTYRAPGGTEQTLDAAWRVVSLPSGIASPPEGTPIGEATQGLDFETEVFRALKRELAARHQDPESIGLKPTVLPAIFEASERAGPDGTQYGYLRIRSFAVQSAQQAWAEFAQLLARLPDTGLVIDVRDNPGGSIQAAEMILQSLAPRRLDRAPLVFRATPFILRLCERWPEMYGRWMPSLLRTQRTGAVFSAAAPLWPDATYEGVVCLYSGPIVLIVNALSYSATDFFAAGFQDHAIGCVLGVDPSTGGGGANVTTLRGLVDEIGADRDRFAGLFVPLPLPAGADLHVALRRSFRTGPNSGLEVEDFGVVPDAPVHAMTRRDVLEGNPDLFTQAVGLLQQRRRSPP